MRGAWQLPAATDTMQLGALLAHACPWGAREPRLLFLSGELGAGKTTLAAGLLEALGVAEAVRSPSYTLIETYPLRLGLAVHVDLYRLQGPEELEPLGLRDYFAPQYTAADRVAGAGGRNIAAAGSRGAAAGLERPSRAASAASKRTPRRARRGSRWSSNSPRARL